MKILHKIAGIVIILILIHACNGDYNADNNDDDDNGPVIPEKPCPGLATIDYEGKTYHTVLVGDQCWLREALDAGEMINSSQAQTDNDKIEKYCYDNKIENCNKYGGLYQWDEAMKYTIGEEAQGICPPGFHIPTDEEFKILEGTVDNQYGVGDPVWNQLEWRGYDAGGNLKITGTEYWGTPNTGATNASGWTALPHGYKENNANTFSGYAAYLTMWTSQEFNNFMVWRRALSYYYAQVFRSYHDKKFGYSVRCIKD